MPQLVDRAAAVAAVLAELDVHRKEPVLITLPNGPGFAESFAGAVDKEALPLPAGPLLSASELAAAAAVGARLVLASPDQLPAWGGELDTEPTILINGPQGPRVARAATAVTPVDSSRVLPWLCRHSYAIGAIADDAAPTAPYRGHALVPAADLVVAAGSTVAAGHRDSDAKRR